MSTVRSREASCITVLVGQCGLQVGDSCLDELHTSLEHSSTERGATGVSDCSMAANAPKLSFFNENGFARSVLVDTETKVVTSLLSKSRKWKYGKEKDVAVMEQGGAANNWAYGYKKKGPGGVGDLAMEAIRKQAEASDYLGGFFIIGSAAGGTGSGVGSFLSECLWDEYATTPSVHSIVLPFETGEVAVQGLNSVLSLGHLLGNGGGGTFVFQNEVAANRCLRNGNPHPTLPDLNRLIARDVASTLVGGGEAFFSTVVSQLWSRSDSFPFAELYSVPQTSDAAVHFTHDSWEALDKELERASTKTKMVAASLFLHGTDTASALNLTCRAPKWAKFPSWAYKPWSSYEYPQSWRGYARDATLATNSGFVVRPLTEILSKATDMLAARAYVHQYAAHGIELCDFENSILRLDRVLSMYSSLL